MANASLKKLADLHLRQPVADVDRDAMLAAIASPAELPPEFCFINDFRR